MNEYKTRKNQIDSFASEFLDEIAIELTPAHLKKLNHLLRDTAMCAAAEERSRTIRIPGHSNLDSRVAVYDEIVKLPVLAILGYEGEQK